MKLSMLIGFAACALALFLVLGRAGFDERKSALLRLDESLSRDSEFKEAIAKQCHSLAGRQTSGDEKFIVTHYSPTPGSNADKNCLVSIQSASRSRFGLVSDWNFGIVLQTEDSHTIFNRNYLLHFPKPRTLWPIVLLFLAIVFEVPFWGWAATASTYLLLIAGLNPLHLLRLFKDTLPIVIQSEGAVVGLMFLACWVAIAANRSPKPTVEDRGLFRNIQQGGALVAFFAGLWNPAVFTLTAPLVQVFRGALHRLVRFLDAQLLMVALSLYCLTLDNGGFATSLLENLLLPRYLTVALLPFLFLSFRNPARNKSVVPFSAQSLVRAVLIVGGIEVAAALQWLPFEVSTLTRLSIGLLLSEAVWPYGVDWRRATSWALLWSAAIFGTQWFGVLIREVGAAQFVFGLLDPRMHPTALVFFTFLCSLLLSLITGSFSATYFPLVALLANYQGEPLARAALLEGILAGLFLSPFSIFNLLPAVQFRLSPSGLINLRLQQLGFPLIIATIIYAISSLSSIGILRPVTFIFLCLLGLFIQLRKQQWRVGEWISGKMPAAP